MVLNVEVNEYSKKHPIYLHWMFLKKVNAIKTCNIDKNIKKENNYMISIKQIQGKGKEKNEDVVFVDDKDCNYLFVGIADGQSLKEHSIEGGKFALSRVNEYFKKQNIGNLKLRYIDEIQYEIISVIRDGLNILAKEKGKNVFEFSSTLCALVIDKNTGEWVIVNLGDGVIVGITREKQVQILSYPENGVTKQYTYLTTSRNVLSHIRIGCGNAKDSSSVLLLTDGVRGIYRDGVIPLEISALLKQNNYLEIGKIMEKLSGKDDGTMVAVSMEEIL